MNDNTTMGSIIRHFGGGIGAVLMAMGFTDQIAVDTAINDAVGAAGAIASLVAFGMSIYKNIQTQRAARAAASR